MRYWHELTNKEVDDLIEKKKTWGDIMNEYKQPDWCGYPEALSGTMGCWSLTGSNRTTISKEWCSSCELCIK